VLIGLVGLGQPLIPVGQCTLDAKVCPDGSVVARVPPGCEFPPCTGRDAPVIDPQCPPGTRPHQIVECPPADIACMADSFRCVGTAAVIDVLPAYRLRPAVSPVCRWYQEYNIPEGCRFSRSLLALAAVGVLLIARKAGG
jgi:hypothetical protein